MYRVIVADNQVDLESDVQVDFIFAELDKAVAFVGQMLDLGKAVEVFNE